MTSLQEFLDGKDKYNALKHYMRDLLPIFIPEKHLNVYMENGFELIEMAFTKETVSSRNLEVLEAVGDAFLGSFVLIFIQRNWPELNSRQQANNMQTVLVDRITLLKIVNELGFLKYARTDKEAGLTRKERSDFFESFLGALVMIGDVYIRKGIGQTICFNFLEKVYTLSVVKWKPEDPDYYMKNFTILNDWVSGANGKFNTTSSQNPLTGEWKTRLTVQQVDETSVEHLPDNSFPKTINTVRKYDTEAGEAATGQMLIFLAGLSDQKFDSPTEKLKAARDFIRLQDKKTRVAKFTVGEAKYPVLDFLEKNQLGTDVAIPAPDPQRTKYFAYIQKYEEVKLDGSRAIPERKEPFTLRFLKTASRGIGPDKEASVIKAIKNYSSGNFDLPRKMTEEVMKEKDEKLKDFMLELFSTFLPEKYLQIFMGEPAFDLFRNAMTSELIKEENKQGIKGIGDNYFKAFVFWFLYFNWPLLETADQVDIVKKYYLGEENIANYSIQLKLPENYITDPDVTRIGQEAKADIFKSLLGAIVLTAEKYIGKNMGGPILFRFLEKLFRNQDWFFDIDHPEESLQEYKSYSNLVNDWKLTTRIGIKRPEPTKIDEGFWLAFAIVERPRDLKKLMGVGGIRFPAIFVDTGAYKDSTREKVAKMIVDKFKITKKRIQEFRINRIKSNPRTSEDVKLFFINEVKKKGFELNNPKTRIKVDDFGFNDWERYELKAFSYMKRKEQVNVDVSPFIQEAFKKRLMGNGSMPETFSITRVVAQATGFISFKVINNRPVPIGTENITEKAIRNYNKENYKYKTSKSTENFPEPAFDGSFIKRVGSTTTLSKKKEKTSKFFTDLDDLPMIGLGRPENGRRTRRTGRTISNTSPVRRRKGPRKYQVK